MNVQVVITISISGVILAIRLLPPALLVPKRCSNRRIYKMVDKYHQCFITINKKDLQIHRGYTIKRIPIFPKKRPKSDYFLKQ